MLNYVRKNINAIVVAVCCSLAFASLGGALSWASPSLVKLRDNNSSIILTSSQESWIGSLIAIGAVVVAIPYTYFFNTSGRKWLIRVLATFYVAGWVPLIFATEVTHIYIGRFILGCAVGPTYGVIPVYLSEVVSKHVRGSNVTLLVISQSIGSLLQYIVGPIISFQSHNIVSIVFPVLLLFCSFAIMESPYYLLRKNKEEEAKQVLLKLRGADRFEDVEEEFCDMKKCLEESPQMSYRELFKELSVPKTRKIIAIISIGTFAQQFSGVGAIIVYMESIFKQMESPISPKYAVVLTEILGDITVAGTFILIDKVNRKSLLLFASMICVIADVTIGMYFIGCESDIISKSYAWIGMVGIFLVQIGYGLGLGPVPVLVMSEVMSFSLKGWLSGYYLIVQGIYNASSIKLFQIISDEAGSYYSYWMFAASILISISILMFIMPETKGKTLLEIQHILTNKHKNMSEESEPQRTKEIDSTNV